MTDAVADIDEPTHTQVRFSDESPATRPNLEVVMEALRTIEGLGAPATREQLKQTTGLTMQVVDHCIKRLRGLGAIETTTNQYKLVPEYRPSRPLTTTFFGDGAVRLEIGDVNELFTPAEAMEMGMAFAGRFAASIVQIQTSELQKDLRQAQAQIRKLQRQA